MARFTGLSLSAWGQGRETARVQGGEFSEPPRFSLERNFPRPFGFLRATLTAAEIPQSQGRRTLLFMGIALAGVVLIGLFAIYQSARVVLDHSERRSRFVSSVTHELKTPLTNIRMYVEMLEQGMARSPDRESDYYRILDSESARLSRLINNVLEFSRLETRQRRLELKQGSLDEVLSEVEEIMRERVSQEGFRLRVQKEEMPPVLYDREAMVQILINLLENSVKFGKGSPLREITIGIRREGERAVVSVSDRGPGIPREALKRVFDDFYRAETALTQTTQGTGIGLALVRKLAKAMGGSVRAANNQGPGCTITVSLPLRR
jgi:signal transduction histidine kinase